MRKKKEHQQQDDMVNYLGKLVPKEFFRVFIYDKDCNQKLVESWDEYEIYIDSGKWFATKEDAKAHQEYNDPGELVANNSESAVNNSEPGEVARKRGRPKKKDD